MQQKEEKLTLCANGKNSTGTRLEKRPRRQSVEAIVTPFIASCPNSSSGGASKRHMGERNLADNPLAEAASWRQRFKNIQNGATPVADRVWGNIHQAPLAESFQLEAVPDYTEIRRAIKKMKVGKAPGADGVTVEMLKWAPENLLQSVADIVQKVWTASIQAGDHAEADEWPQDWLQAIVIPLWKRKRPKSNKGNWRGVTLLSVGVKTLARIVATRVQSFSEQFMDEEQQGFRTNRGVDDVPQTS